MQFSPWSSSTPSWVRTLLFESRNTRIRSRSCSGWRLIPILRMSSWTRSRFLTSCRNRTSIGTLSWKSLCRVLRTRMRRLWKPLIKLWLLLSIIRKYRQKSTFCSYRSIFSFKAMRSVFRWFRCFKAKCTNIDFWTTKAWFIKNCRSFMKGSRFITD